MTWATATPQPVRFLFAGGFAAGVNWVVRFPLSQVMPFTIAVFAATMIGMCVGFGLYQTIVFPGSRRSLLPQLRDFVLVNLAGSAVVVVVSALAERMLASMWNTGVAEAGAHAIGIAAGALLNYAGHRLVTFGDLRQPSGPRVG